jgi:hypothetical protein
VSERTHVKLPAGATPPLRVFISGVPQKEGEDFVVKDDELVFARKLDKEGRLGFWRWTSIFLGLVGTYRKNDVVDVHWTAADGKTQVVSGLPFEP